MQTREHRLLSCTHSHTLTHTHHGLEWEGHAVGVGESNIGKSVRNFGLHLLAGFPELELHAYVCVGMAVGVRVWGEVVGWWVWVHVGCGCRRVSVGVGGEGGWVSECMQSWPQKVEMER